MSTRCGHALLVSGCFNCTGLDPLEPPPRRFCGDNFRHAIRESWCPDCKGLEGCSRVEPRISIREQAIRAASEEERAAIKAWRQGWRSLKEVLCHWCKQAFAPDACHADHVIPLSRGGLHDLTNLVIACAACNVKKHARMPEVWAEIIATT